MPENPASSNATAQFCDSLKAQKASGRFRVLRAGNTSVFAINRGELLGATRSVRHKSLINKQQSEYFGDINAEAASKIRHI